jgi:hypothetical protein
MRDIARALALPLLGDPELEGELMEILKPHDDQAKVDRHGEPEWVVMIALYAKIHRTLNIPTTLTAKQITVEVEAVLKNAGETYHLEPRKVGDILRSLRFPTQELGNQGRGLWMSKKLVRKIHTTAKDLGLCRADIFYPEVTESGFGGPPCSVCEEVGLMFDHDGRRLQSPERFRGRTVGALTSRPYRRLCVPWRTL